MSKNCKQCGQPSGDNKFCCNRCKWTWHNRNRTLTPNVVGPCVICGEHVERWESPSRQRAEKDGAIYCSRTCAGRGRTGANHPAWKGGRTVDKGGYVLVYMPTHPHANAKGMVREHRIVMERKIGRTLKRSEVVHHKNGNTSDNRISNLVLYPSNREHKKHDYKNRNVDSHGRLLPKGEK